MKSTLICTVGTSLFKPNLFNLPSAEKDYENWLSKQPEDDRQYLSYEFIKSLKAASDKLKAALDKKDCEAALDEKDFEHLAELLGRVPGTTRLCGAEINSITDLIQREYCTKNCTLFFCHSATPDGQHIAEILRRYYKQKGHHTEPQEIEHLQDAQPKLFRTKGLRNLAKKMSRIIYDKKAQFCAINATGGYKAQIAIGVLMGQALEVPVYYKHELFSEIIAFPPMPISLDFRLWLEKSELLTALERWEKIKGMVARQDLEQMVAWQDVDEEWDERMEALVERVDIDGKVYLEISPTGQIFHETFKGRFESVRSRVLPSPVLENEKRTPRLSNHGWGNARKPILDFLQKIVDECPYVRTCYGDYWNPTLPSPVLFRLRGEEIEGIFSNGTWTVKFIVETSANTPEQRAACVADMNRLTEN
ncbi:putative CRISPR-associated protein [Argonema galeatum]|uniref:putative CRISPR-associated protein n=1 Tax=Argonema galeatum TaxID=2942762 RepID=UPI002013A75E|nr:putative CRISPR-associated protein [Argonema galeatum]MCL1465980.1 putative CRISPR-associated protein [Argonema galeatum A003/A1]